MRVLRSVIKRRETRKDEAYLILRCRFDGLLGYDVTEAIRSWEKDRQIELSMIMHEL